MPYLMPRPCSVPGCSSIGRCMKHVKQPSMHSSIRHRLYDAQRDNSGQRGYDYTWQQRRKAYITRRPLCVQCGRSAHDVDHIVPLRHGGLNDEDNYQSLCRSCHNRKTNRDKRIMQSARAVSDDTAIRE